MRKSALKPDVAIATRFTAKLPLVGVHFAHIHGQLVAPFSDGELAWNLRTVQVGWLRDGGLLKVIVPYKIDMSVTAPGQEEKPFAAVEVILRVDYSDSAVGEVSDDELSHFAAVHGLMHSWPYLRAEVQSLTAKLEFSPLTLPPLVTGQIPALATVFKLPALEKEGKAAPALAGKPLAEGSRVKKAPKRRGK